MVKLTKIYTRTGDDGTTGLGTGGRVRKDDLRVEAYGTVDEANAAIGLAIADSDPRDAHQHSLAGVLASVQQDLFDVGADLCVPVEPGEGKRLRVQAEQTARLERLIDQHNEGLGTLTSFVLPGGTPLAAGLHLARTIVRRAERLAVSLAVREASKCNPEVVRYLNRASDLLFVLARSANRGRDVLWIPGANRA